MDSLTTSRSRDDARDLLTLDALPGVGPVRVRALVARFGSARGALHASPDRFAAIAGEEAARARRDRSLGARIDRALDRAQRLGMRIVTWGDPAYPPDLGELADPPPVLFLRGRFDLLTSSAPAVTIVGSRRVTVRGRDLARRLGMALGRSGATVVSGLALGVDGQAHRGALEVDGNTVAVLGTGPDVRYPRTHARLFDRILERGLVVSEFLPGTPAAPHHFPRRNRVLAGLGRQGVAVVEAGRRSGSLITVDHALDLGREVWTVPGPIDGPACVGSNQLLIEGARPIVDLDAFVAEVCATAPASAPRRSTPDGEPEGAWGVVPGVDVADRSTEVAVLKALDRETLEATELAGRTRLDVAEVLAALTLLEVRGAVERLPGLRFRRAA